jgi:hypothetical protein
MNATTQDPMSEPGLSGAPLRPGTLPVSPARARDTLPGSRRCSATTAAGAPCKAWAVHAPSPDGPDPPLCSAHAGRNVGAGAPLGNQNRTTHGFYASVLSRNEPADILEAAGLTTLESEIACTRTALHRLLKILTESGDDLSPLDYARMASVAFHGARTIARLMRDNKAIAGFPPGFFDWLSKE